MNTPDEHRAYLAKQNYDLGCSPDVFDAKEIELIKRYGYWMEALVTGLVSATTEAQARLIQVHRDEIEPTSPHERVWWKLIQRRKWEKELRESPHYEVADKSEQWFSRLDWKKMHE